MNIFYPLIRTRLSHTHTFPPSDRCVCASGAKKCLFFGKFDVLCFLWFWDLPFCIITNVLIKWNSKIIYSYDMMLRPRIFRVCRKSLRARYACYVFMYFFFWRGQNHFLKQWRHCKVGSEYPVLGFLSLWKYFWETGPYWHIMFQNLQYTHWKLNRCFWLFHDGGPYHLETSPLISRASGLFSVWWGPRLKALSRE